MVLIDGVKWACDGCIRGHRTSKCTHTDRALTEIKKKGRPVSQCQECRSLRKDKSIHVKCECSTRSKKDRKPKTLANGLADLVKSPSPESEADLFSAPRGLRVSQLLNPCNCRRGGKCNCSGSSTAVAPSPTPSLSSASSSATGSCCSSKSKAEPLPPSIPFVASVLAGSPSSSPARSDAPAALNLVVKPSPRAGGCCSSKSKVATSPIASSFGSLFLPTTHGTAACFCGESCACVGCPQHDPLGRKAAERGIFGSASKAAVECRCSGGDAGGEAGAAAKKPCCGGAMGQLQVAQTEGMGELARVIAKAKEDLSGLSGTAEGGLRLPPMLEERERSVKLELPSFDTVKAWGPPTRESRVQAEERPSGCCGAVRIPNNELLSPESEMPTATDLFTSSLASSPPVTNPARVSAAISSISPPHAVRRSARSSAPSTSSPKSSPASRSLIHTTPSESGDACACLNDCGCQDDGSSRASSVEVAASLLPDRASPPSALLIMSPRPQQSPAATRSSSTRSPIDWDALVPPRLRKRPRSASPRHSISSRGADDDTDIRAEEIEGLGPVCWPKWADRGIRFGSGEEGLDDDEEFAVAMVAAGF